MPSEGPVRARVCSVLHTAAGDLQGRRLPCRPGTLEGSPGGFPWRGLRGRAPNPGPVPPPQPGAGQPGGSRAAPAPCLGHLPGDGARPGWAAGPWVGLAQQGPWPGQGCGEASGPGAMLGALLEHTLHAGYGLKETDLSPPGPVHGGNQNPASGGD